MDETELSFCASKRGGKHPQNNVIVNSSLPQPGHRGTKAMCSHTTGVFITSAAGEVGPVFIIESSRAKEVDKRHIQAEMLLGLPRVVAQFGHAEPQTFEATIASTTNGSMETGLWGQYLDACVYPLFPDLSPNNPAVLFVDGGPGRLENIDALIKAQRAGLHIFPLFPNGSAYAQPNDQIYGTLKLKIYHKMDKLEREKGVSLSRRSLGEILNGTPEDPLNDRPFSSTFTRTNILSAWQAVGAVPFTRASLRNAPLRDPSSAAGTLQELNKHLSECEALGIDVQSKGGRIQIRRVVRRAACRATTSRGHGAAENCVHAQADFGGLVCSRRSQTPYVPHSISRPSVEEEGCSASTRGKERKDLGKPCARSKGGLHNPRSRQRGRKPIIAGTRHPSQVQVRTESRAFSSEV